MRRALIPLIAALLLAATPALAGGEGGSSPFSGQKKAPAPGTDPGFDTAVAFFGLFLSGNYHIGAAYVAGYIEVDHEDLDREYYGAYWYRRSKPDPAAEKKHYDAINRIFAEVKADLDLDSPRAAPNKAPVRDPDDLPGLDY